MVRRAAALVGLAAALVALAFPAFASALIKIDSAEDEPKSTAGAVCETAAGKCTLRAAIEATNAGSSFQVIEFDISVFNGNPATSTVQLGSPLEPIKQPMTITGHHSFGPSYISPTAAVIAPAGAPALTVEAAGVTIADIAFSGGETGIEVTNSATGFKSFGNWFGLKLDATANSIGTAGILLGPGADEATIGGGTEETERNVFANATVGVQIEGASKVKILGNYLGVGPTGLGAASLEEGVRIVDTMASPAAENEIGGVLTSGEVATTKCDGPCNVIATDLGQGVNLAGSSAEPATAATGPTVIRGNYLGLGADGTTPVGENAFGVLAAPSSGGCAAGPGDVTVGGTAATESNFIEGGIEAIYAEAAENFSAIGNAIGVAPGGSASASPQNAGVALCNSGVSEPSLVAGNRMMLSPDAVGVVSDSGRAQIVGNSIKGGLIGVLTAGESAGAGDLIQGNTVVGTDREGMLIANDSNVVVGNTVSGSEWSGIEIEEGGEHNRIGGDLAGEANTINEAGFGNPGSAIVIEGEESSRNEVAANTGFGNAGAFIELEGHSNSEIPNGLEPPTVTAALQSSATGTAVAGTKVRIFSKAKPEAGELGGYIGSVTTDSAGVWKATFAKVPIGILIAATQTSDAGTPAAGTSEVSAPVAATADPETPSGGSSAGSSSGSGASNPPPMTPPKAPKVKITAGPKKSSTATTAKFKFKAEPAAGARFECKLDGAKWAKCGSPKTYKKLKPRKHTFQVRAIASGLTGAATKFKFTVKS